MAKRAPKLNYQTMPPQLLEGPVSDRQAQFRKLTRSAPAERGSERAFLASKFTMLRTHPGITEEKRASGEATLARLFGAKALEALDKKKAGPAHGVGYGFFYENAFRGTFTRGTSLYYEIVCPNQPGGNVNDHLYLTATNRAQKGVEALVAYKGQNDTRFLVFDWARSDPSFQRNIPFTNLTSYLSSTVAHGRSLQRLVVWNTSVEIGANQWRNQVLLHNRAANRWDLVYQFDYGSTTAEQQDGWSGSWGPIVETFQPRYSNTKPLGFLNTALMACNAAGQWGDWSLLGPNQSRIRNDNLGFSPLFIDPNFSVVLKS